MGRMINIFDLSTGMPRNKPLTDKPHQDVSPIHGSRPDMKKTAAMDNFGVQKEDKTIMNHLGKSSSKKSSGTTLKMLIAQEMSSEPQSKQKPSNVVAKLMGLDTLPVQQSEGYSHKSQSGEFRGYWSQEDSSHHNTGQFDAKSCVHDSEYKDGHEIWQQPPRNTHIEDKPPQYKKHDENPIEKRMELVHQKFIEARRLSTDEKLLQSREFQEALGVLSSNMDFFLKFLEEQNAPSLKRLRDLQPCPTDNGIGRDIGSSCFVGFDHTEASSKRNDASSESFQHFHSEESISINSEGRIGKASSSSTTFNGLNHSASIPNASLSFEKSGISENYRENQDQPSPIADLEAPFEYDASSSICQPSPSLISAHPQALSRSPSIGSISRTLTRENPLGVEMEQGFQPNGTVQDSGKCNAVVLYFTSLRGIRKTYDDCCSVKAMLREYCVRIDERDVSMHGEFKEELKGMTRDGNCRLPRVFLDGRDLGGAEELKRMHENDELAKVFEGCAKDSREKGETREECEVCGDVRFVMCGLCSGSCRVYDNDDEEGIAGGGGWRQCSNCNVNGILRCPVCC